MGKRENKVETYLNDEVEKLGGITRKWVSPGRDGVPDRIVIINGWIPFVETKTIDGRLSDVQIREQKRLTDNGAEVFNLYGISHVDKFIRKYVKPRA